MRLVDTKTLQFGEFFDKPVPKYAILSHRWTEDEVSYQTYLQCESPQSQTGPGFGKIRGLCRFAQAQNPPIGWAWIDTCCIDKKSSQELTEGINSMYGWYQPAQVCVVYLHDFDLWKHHIDQDRWAAFKQCEWFQRGWTLQELLAPGSITFCARDWFEFGDMDTLCEEVSIASGIPQCFLNGDYDPRDASVAMRMSWASRRETTKLEDMAYCLLGLFDINMPLLYGEKEKSFVRLQQEIVTHSDDESIFAWKANLSGWGMLAPSPKAFCDAGNIVNLPLNPAERMPYHMTNKGLEIRSASDTNAVDEVDESTGHLIGYPTHTMELGCFDGLGEVMIAYDKASEKMWQSAPLAIRLIRVGWTWHRVECHCFRARSNAHRKIKENGTYVGRAMQRVYIVSQPELSCLQEAAFTKTMYHCE